jgi:hypothetical protein
MRKRVMIESPYAGDTAANLAYLQRCVEDSLSRDEAPFASHGFYTAYLHDDQPEQRALGIACGYAWLFAAELVVFYCDRGMSPGMMEALKYSAQYNLPVMFRWLDAKETPAFNLRRAC